MFSKSPQNLRLANTNAETPSSNKETFKLKH